MRWFKHMVAANRDEKLLQVIDEFGVAGYGAYWLILETIAEKITKDVISENEVFFEISDGNLRKILRFSPKKSQKYLTFLQKLGLFSVKNVGNVIQIYCPNLLKYRDEYTSRVGVKNRDIIPSVSGQTTLQRQNTETEAETDKELHPTDVRPQSCGTDPDEEQKNGTCPHEKIITIYHEKLSSLPRVRIWGKKNESALKMRWKEDKQRQSLEWWSDFFQYVSHSDFLTGKTKAMFVPDLEWLITRGNFEKVLNGRYENRGGDIRQKKHSGIEEWLRVKQQGKEISNEGE